MATPQQPNAMTYTQGFGSSPLNVQTPHLDVRNPSTSDIQYPVGKRWVNSVANSTWSLTSFSATAGVTSATWVAEGGGSSALATLSGDTGTAVPTAGNIALHGTANQITTAASGSTVTFSVPATFIAPGSIASTTTMTAGTGLTVTSGGLTVTAGGISVTAGNITTVAGSINSATNISATLGNITATDGNFVASTAGTGVVFTPVTASGATPVTTNGRVFAATFTGVSIAAGADTALVVSNTSIAGASTLIQYTLVGATAGAALTIESVVNALNQSTVTVTNGTGATTSTANITLIGTVLN